jgi:hypothetical protein
VIVGLVEEEKKRGEGWRVVRVVEAREEVVVEEERREVTELAIGTRRRCDRVSNIEGMNEVTDFESMMTEI